MLKLRLDGCGGPKGLTRQTRGYDMRRAALVGLVCFLAIVSGTVAQGATSPSIPGVEWTPVGLGGGGAQYHPVITPGNPDVMYGFSGRGGVYRSIDAGHTWRMYSADEINSCITSCDPVFNPFSGNVLYVGTASGLKRTTDGGNSWQTINSITPDTIAINPVDRAVMFAGVTVDDPLFGKSYLICESTDRGLTWNDVPSWELDVNEAVTDLFVDPNSLPDQPTVYAATPAGIYRTMDGAVTWARVDGGLPVGASISDFKAGAGFGTTVLYATVKGYGIYRSIDGGDSWESVNTGFNVDAAGDKDMELGLCANNPTVVYVGSQEDAGPTIYKTTDAGTHWSKVLSDPMLPDFPIGVTVSPDWITNAFGWWMGREPHQIEVCATNPDVVAFSEDVRTWRSDDGGASWFCCNTHETSSSSGWWTSNGFETATSYNVKFAPWSRETAFITYSDIGLARSEDRGFSWRISSTGSPYPYNFYDLAIDPTVYGKMWAAASDSPDMPHGEMLHGNLTDLSGGVVKSIDGGATWTDVGQATGLAKGPATSITVDPASPSGNRTLYVTVMGSGVYKSTDDGATWTAANYGLGMPHNMNAWMIKIMPDGALFCALCESYDQGRYWPGGLFKSNDGAETWTLISATVTLPHINGFDVDPTNENNIYVATFDDVYGMHSGLWKTTDDGASWTSALSRGNTRGVAIDPEVPTRVYATTEAGDGIYMSDDSGATWSKIAGLPFEVKGPAYVSFDPEDSQQIYVTTYGGGVWKATVPHLKPDTYEYAANEQESLVKGDRWYSKVSTRFTPDASDDWLVIAFAEYRIPRPKSGLEIRLAVDGATESLTSAKAANRSDYATFMTMAPVALAAGEHTVSLDARGSNASSSGFVRRARVIAIRKADLEWYTAQQSGATTLATAPAECASLNWTVAAQGDYLLLWSADFMGAKGAGTTIQATFNDSEADACYVKSKGSANALPFMAVAVADCAAGNQKITLAASKSGGAAAQTVSHARLAAIRLTGSRFGAAAHSSYASEFATTSTTFVNALTTEAATAPAGDCLMLSTFRLANSKTSRSIEAKVSLNDSTISARPMRRTAAKGEYLNAGSMDVRFLPSGPQSVAIDARAVNRGATAKVKCASIVMIPLESGVQ